MFKIDKMFALDKAFMFRFEADPGQPENDNHKVIPTYRAISKFGINVIQEMVRRFLSISPLQWRPRQGSLKLVSTKYRSKW